MRRNTVTEISQEELEGRVAAILAVAPSVQTAVHTINRNFYDSGVEVIKVTFDVNNDNGRLVNVAEIRHPRYGDMRIEHSRLPAKHLVS